MKVFTLESLKFISNSDANGVSWQLSLLHKAEHKSQQVLCILSEVCLLSPKHFMMTDFLQVSTFLTYNFMKGLIITLARELLGTTEQASLWVPARPTLPLS